MRRVLPGAGFLCGVLALLASLAPQPAAAADAAPAVMGDGGTVRVLDNPFSTQSYARIVMQKYKLDRKYGITLDVLPAGTTPAAITAFQSGGADIALFNWLDIARMRNNGIMVTGFAPFLQFGADYWVVPKDSPIRTIGDFKGRKIGIYSKTSINWVITVAVAKKVYDFDLDKEATVQEAAANLVRALLEQGQLDASHIFNNLTPDLMVTGRFRIMAQIKDEVDALGLPSTPFLMWAADDKYAAAHPGNVKAFAAAYRDAVEILRTDDEAWIEHAKELQMTDAAIPPLRDEMRVDTWSRFQPQNEADIRKTFDVLEAIAGARVMGMETLPARFMTLDDQ